jgi:hypothetical protein
VSLTSSDLELILNGVNQQVVGVRFTGLNIPPGATVQNAYIQFQADEANSEATTLAISGQAIDNAPTFTSTIGNISSRTTTTASVAWSPAAWTTTGEAGQNQRTPDIGTVIQEIVGRSGWALGNSLAVIITGTGKRVAESFNGVASAAPLLVVEYLANNIPIAANDSATTYQYTPVTTNVLTNDFLGDPPTSITSVTQGTNGAVTVDVSAGTTTYTPAGNFFGNDSYTYTITDAEGDTSTATVDITVAGPLNIRVVADVPYSSGEYADLEADLANVGADDEFFVHLGDIKSGSDPCVETVYSNAATSLQTSTIPVFIIPGDNEWNDCSSPSLAWSYWDTHLMGLEQNWSPSFTVLRQSARQENFAFVHSGVLFMGFNLVGGSVPNSSQVMTDNVNWLNENFNNFGSQVNNALVFGHAFPDGDRQEFGDAFETVAQNFGKPILYMMGDDHSWVLDNPFSGAPNVTRVTLDQGVPSVRVTISNHPTEPFTFDQSPLMLQSNVSPPPGAASIDTGQLAPIVDEAISLLSQVAGPEVANDLAGLDIQVVDLPGSMLGRALPGAIQIDVDAAGFGWFVDATPSDNSEFVYDIASDQFVSALGGSASERVDLLTVVLHELGHLLGSEHTDSNSWMDSSLPLGTRRLPNQPESSLELTVQNVDRFYQLFDSLDDA